MLSDFDADGGQFEDLARKLLGLGGLVKFPLSEDDGLLLVRLLRWSPATFLSSASTRSHSERTRSAIASRFRIALGQRDELFPAWSRIAHDPLIAQDLKEIKQFVVFSDSAPE